MKRLLECDRDLEEDENNVEALLERSQIYFQKEDFELSLKDCDAILALEPNDYKTLDFRGLNYQKMNAHEEAIENFSKAIECSVGEFNKPFVNRSISYFKLEEYQKSFSDVDLFISNSNVEEVPWKIQFLKAQVFYKLKSFGDALAEVDSLLPKALSEPLVFYFRGHTQKKMKDYKRAGESFKEAERICAGYYQESWITVCLELFLEPIKDLTEKILYQRSKCYYLRKKYSKSINYLEIVINLNSGNKKAIELMSLAYTNEFEEPTDTDTKQEETSNNILKKIQTFTRKLNR